MNRLQLIFRQKAVDASLMAFSGFTEIIFLQKILELLIEITSRSQKLFVDH